MAVSHEYQIMIFFHIHSQLTNTQITNNYKNTGGYLSKRGRPDTSWHQAA